MIVGIACGCGGRAHQIAANSIDAGATDATGTTDGDNHFLVGVASAVPAGTVFFGSWIFDSTINKFRPPKDCNAVGRAGQEPGANRQLAIAAFWLSKIPVTNQLYGYCVGDGVCSVPDHDIADPNTKSWDDPARAELPVYTRHDQAEKYCKWAAGRLPTAAELTRSAQGDAEIPGIAALTQAVIDCSSGDAGGVTSSATCQQLQLMNYSQSPSPPLYRTDAVELDHGPYGHADLFGSVWEWTQSFVSDSELCALADGSPDFVTFDPTGQVGISDILSFATPLVEAAETVSAQSVKTASAQLMRAQPNSMNRYNVGFRCAFDTPQ